MNLEEREAEHQWALKMLALEEELGEIPPGGASGGVGARARLAAQGKAMPSAAMRARRNVRFVVRAVRVEKQAA